MKLINEINGATELNRKKAFIFFSLSDKSHQWTPTHFSRSFFSLASLINLRFWCKVVAVESTIIKITNTKDDDDDNTTYQLNTSNRLEYRAEKAAIWKNTFGHNYLREEEFEEYNVA